MPTPATADDVLASVKRFADGSGLATLLRGGWHHERPDAKAPMPWAVAKIAEGERTRYYGGQNIEWNVTIEVRTAEGTDDRRAIATELAKLDGCKFLTLPGTDGRVIHCLAVPGNVTADPNQYQARDVGLTVSVFKILVSNPKASVSVAIGGGNVAIGGGSTAIGATA